MKNDHIHKLVLAGLLAALAYVVFTFLQIKIPVGPGGATSIHLGNAVCVLGGLLLGGMYGAIGGAIGLTISDLMDPVYIVEAPKTFILKLCIGLITGYIAHRLGHISTETDRGKIRKWTILAASGGLGFNMIFDPLFGYFYKLLFLGKPMADLTLFPNMGATAINAVASAIVSVLVYLALRPVLIKSGLFITVPDKKARESTSGSK